MSKSVENTLHIRQFRSHCNILHVEFTKSKIKQTWPMLCRNSDCTEAPTSIFHIWKVGVQNYLIWSCTAQTLWVMQQTSLICGTGFCRLVFSQYWRSVCARICCGGYFSSKNNIITRNQSQQEKERERKQESKREEYPKKTAREINLQSCLFQLIEILSEKPSKHSALPFVQMFNRNHIIFHRDAMYPLTVHTHKQHVCPSAEHLHASVLFTCRYLHSEHAPKRS